MFTETPAQTEVCVNTPETVGWFTTVTLVVNELATQPREVVKDKYMGYTPGLVNVWAKVKLAAVPTEVVCGEPPRYMV